MEQPILFDQFFTNTMVIYNFILISPYELYVRPAKTRFKRLLGLVTYWFTFTSSALVILMQTLYLVFLVDRTDDIVEIIASAAWIPVSMIALDGTLFTWTMGPRMTRLIGRIEATFPATLEAQDFGNVRETFAKWDRMSWIVMRTYLFALFIIFFQPPALLVLGYFMDGSVVLKMPRLMWYPFDHHNAPFWIQTLVYIWECWGTLVTTRAAVAIGLIMGSFVTLLCVQFDVLARQFHELVPGRRPGLAATDYGNLIELVKRHTSLIEICDEFRNICRMSLIMNYILSSVVIGCFGFLILNEPVISQKTEYICDFICFMCYNSMFSFYGDSLMDRSRGISRAIFESNWMEADIKYKKDLLFIMARTCKPIILDGFFFTVSYETYYRILTTSYSYLALLLATYRKQK